MATQIVPIYSQEEQRALRFKTCQSCTLSACNGNQSNKCNVDSLVCTLDNQNIRIKAFNLSNKCARGFWDNTNATKSVYVAPSCGCGK